jgi:hypothetical protein
MPPIGRPRRHADAAAKQAAYRRRQQAHASATAQLIALQADCAQQHLAQRYGLSLQKQATAEQRQLQAELKERDMLDALWVLQTLVADFGYADVERCVLQHVRPDAGGHQADPFPLFWTQEPA